MRKALVVGGLETEVHQLKDARNIEEVSWKQMLAYLLGLLKMNIAMINSLKGKNVKLIVIIVLRESMS